MSEKINTDEGPEELKKESPLSIDEAETSNFKSEENKMDTHAHHLHHAPGEKIWHYIYEFLMLFLAVTSGFYVENNTVLLTSNWKDILVFSGQIREYRDESRVLYYDLIKNKMEAERLLLLLRKEFHIN